MSSTKTAWSSASAASRTAAAAAAAAQQERMREVSPQSELPPAVLPTEEAARTVFVPLPSPRSSHPLRKPFTFWYHALPSVNQSQNMRSSKYAREAGYGLALRVVATVSTIEEFWCAYTRTLRPSDMPIGSDMFLFESGITPTWEDPKNAQGGRFILRTQKEGTNRLWEELIIALVRGSLVDGRSNEASGTSGISTAETSEDNHGTLGIFETVGAVVSIRGKEDAVSLWVTNAEQPGVVSSTLRGHIDHCLQLPTMTSVDFKKHDGN